MHPVAARIERTDEPADRAALSGRVIALEGKNEAEVAKGALVDEAGKLGLPMLQFRLVASLRKPGGEVDGIDRRDPLHMRDRWNNRRGDIKAGRGKGRRRLGRLGRRRRLRAGQGGCARRHAWNACRLRMGRATAPQGGG